MQQQFKNNQQQANYSAPIGQMQIPQGGFIAPEVGGKTRCQNIQLVPFGLNPARICDVIDLGTQIVEWAGEKKESRRILIRFELPQLKQKFYEEDTELRSTMLMVESSFAHSDKSKLTAICKAVSGIGDVNQLKSFDIQKLLGATILLNISHKTNTKGILKESIDGYAPLGGYQLPPNFSPEAECNMFFVDAQGYNFNTINFAKLPTFLKTKIINSKEGQAHIAKGGTFAKQEQNQEPQQTIAQQNQNSFQNNPAFAQPANIQLTPNAQNSYAEYIAAGWTPETLVQNGLAVYVQQNNVATPPPTQGVVTPPPAQPVQNMQQAQPAQAFQQEQSPLVDDNDLPF